MRLTLAGLLLVPVVLAAAPPQQTTFRSSVDLVAVDVSIVDKDGRPVDDLKLDEFTLKVDGKPRKLSTAEFINLRRADDSLDSERAKYSTNQGARPGRLILLVIDEGNIHKGNGRAIATAAGKFVDGLNPSDRVALEFIPGTGPLVGFTANHSLVKQMLTNGVGKMVEASLSKRVGLIEALTYFREGQDAKTWLEVVDRECRTEENIAGALDLCKRTLANEARQVSQEARAQTTNSLLSLRAIMQRLAVSNSPKTIVLMTEGLVIDRQISDITWVAEAASAAQANMYALQIDGSFVDASMGRNSPTHYEDRELYKDGLDKLIGEAHGTVMPVAVNANAVFSRLDLELSGYYLLSFEPDLVDRDGKAHEITVQSSRPGVTIRSRPQFKVAPAASTRTPDELLVEALKNPLPMSDVGVKLTTFTYRDDTSSKLKVLITAELDRAFNPSGDFSLGYIVTDARGNLAGSQFEKALALPSKDDVGRPQRYTGAVVLDPGIYNVKLAVVDPRGKQGSVERTFEAKLTSAGQLKFGELMLAEVVGRTAKPTVDGRINADTLMTYAEVYSEANGPLQAASIRIEIGKTEHDTPSETASMQFTDRKYEGKRTAEGAVPLAMLAAGDYIARAVFVVDGKAVGQVTRPFTVTHDATPATPGPAPTSGLSTGRERITFSSKIDTFDREAVLNPRVISFFVDRMNVVGLPQTPTALAPAVAAAKAGRFVELQQSLTAASTIHPAASLLAGVAKLSQGDANAAQAQFSDALKASPEFFPAAFYLGAAYAAAGRDADAVATWQTSLITESDAPFVYTLLGDALLRLHRTPDAIGVLREAALLWPDVDDVMMRFGTALAQGGQAADALKVLDPYLIKHADDQDRLMLAMRLIYEAKSAGKPIDTVENDRARFGRYYASYEKIGGAQLSLAAEWKKIVDR